MVQDPAELLPGIIAGVDLYAGGFPFDCRIRFFIFHILPESIYNSFGFLRSGMEPGSGRMVLSGLSIGLMGIFQGDPEGGIQELDAPVDSFHVGLPADREGFEPVAPCAHNGLSSDLAGKENASFFQEDRLLPDGLYRFRDTRCLCDALSRIDMA
jgi:hypothetical protein